MAAPSTAMAAPIVVNDWAKENEHCFAPPICNKLMHKSQITVMFVGGPNSRKDFHIEEGGEFFLQLRGAMELPTVQQGKLKRVRISEGHLFVLPRRIPHSPQRPEAGSLGLVIERCREDGELDCLRWYTDFDVCEEVLYERYFRCEDLGRDLVPVVKQFLASPENETGKPTATSIEPNPPFEQDRSTLVPDPINLFQWIDANTQRLAQGEVIDLLKELEHPDKEFTVHVVGGVSEQSGCRQCETFLYQLRGKSLLTEGGAEKALEQDACYVVPAGREYTIRREKDSVGLVVAQSKVP